MTVSPYVCYVVEWDEQKMYDAKKYPIGSFETRGSENPNTDSLKELDKCAKNFLKTANSEIILF